MHHQVPDTIPIFDLMRDELTFIRDTLLNYERAMHNLQPLNEDATNVADRNRVEHAELQRFDLSLQMLSDLAQLCQHMKETYPSFTPPPIPEDVLKLERSRMKFGDPLQMRDDANADASANIHLF